jgi:hypothetical protein
MNGLLKGRWGVKVEWWWWFANKDEDGDGDGDELTSLELSFFVRVYEDVDEHL